MTPCYQLNVSLQPYCQENSELTVFRQRLIILSPHEKETAHIYVAVTVIEVEQLRKYFNLAAPRFTIHDHQGTTVLA